MAEPIPDDDAVAPEGEDPEAGLGAQPEEELDPFDPEAEGMPALDDLPPGIDGDLAQEAIFPPAQRPIFSESSGTTEAEAAVGESLRERLAQEAGSGRARTEGAVGRLEDEYPSTGEYLAAPSGDRAGLSAEEAAVREEEA